MRSRYLPMLASATMLLSACGDRTTPRSDGSTPGSDLAAWSVESTPIVSIRGVDPEGNPLIVSAEGVTRLPNGEIVVADGSKRSLLWFDAEGGLLRSVGEDGEGRDKFELITGLLRCGDSLFVKDWAGNPPVRVYSPDGTLARAFAFDAPYMPDGCNAQAQFVRMGGASVRRSGEPPGPGEATYALYDADGNLSVRLGNFRSTESLDSPAVGSRIRPLGRETLLAIGRERVYVGTADSFSVLVFQTDGAPLGSIRYDDVDLRTTADDIERFKYHDTSAVSSNLNAKKLRVLNWETFEFPPTVPAYDAMLVDARDMLWLRRMPRRIGGDAEWIVFSQDGAPTARLSLPGDLRVHEVGDDYLAGVLSESGSGTQAVEIYTLRR